MYKEHYAFATPEDENVKIWRYMDFTKFVSLLDKKTLYFCRVDKLGDPFEGSLTEINVKAREAFIKELWERKISNEQLNELFLREPNVNRKIRKSMFVNCWHMSEYESAAMWKMYLKSDEGIAIQSTYKRLKESFNSNSRDHVFIGKVNYIDYSLDAIRRDNWFHLVLHKRKSFEYERELRAMVWEVDIFKLIMGSNKEPSENGMYVETDLDVLIDKIYLATGTPEWFRELVQSIVKKYDFNIKVEKSKLDDKALF